MQESDVIKALECCEAGIDFEVCDNCPRCIEEERAVDCFKRLHKATLDLIKRKDAEIDILIRKKETLRDEIAEKQAEIEEYRAKHKELYKKLSNVQTMAIMVNERADEIKAEAYKEFAERLKNHFWSKADCDVLIRGVIDNLLTELTKGDEGL